MKATKQVTAVEFETYDDIGDVTATIAFDRVTVYSMYLFGADADGNRGVWQESIDEDYAEQITVCFDAHMPPSWTWAFIPLSNLALDTQAQIKMMVNGYLEAHEPEMADLPEPEPESW